MSRMTGPILYSFRRCPYAMRARLAMVQSGLRWEHREILLKDKPSGMLEASPKGTVPVLILPDGSVIDESLDVMLWALAQSDPDNWLEGKAEALALIKENDGLFKDALDHYKYHVRHPEKSQQEHRRDGEVFLQLLESRLTEHSYLMGNVPGLADYAIFPFIRQFVNVDPKWFAEAPYPKLRTWLNGFLESSLFATVMHKFDVWSGEGPGQTFP